MALAGVAFIMFIACVFEALTTASEKEGKR